MESENIVNIVLSVIAAAGTGALFIVASNLAKLLADVNLLRKQLNSQAFISFTSKFDAVIHSFPAGVWKNRKNEIQYEKDTLEKIQDASLAFFHLCSQEYYMYKKGLVDTTVWSIWEKDLMANLCCKLLVSQWETLQGEFDEYHEFSSYVKKLHEKSNNA